MVAQHAPVLHMHPRDLFMPSTVEWFSAPSLFRSHEKQIPFRLSSKLVAGGRSCWQLIELRARLLLSTTNAAVRRPVVNCYAWRPDRQWSHCMLSCPNARHVHCAVHHSELRLGRKEGRSKLTWHTVIPRGEVQLLRVLLPHCLYPVWHDIAHLIRPRFAVHTLLPLASHLPGTAVCAEADRQLRCAGERCTPGRCAGQTWSRWGSSVGHE